MEKQTEALQVHHGEVEGQESKAAENERRSEWHHEVLHFHPLSRAPAGLARLLEEPPEKCDQSDENRRE
jgi:hypothetical protein